MYTLHLTLQRSCAGIYCSERGKQVISTGSRCSHRWTVIITEMAAFDEKRPWPQFLLPYTNRWKRMYVNSINTCLPSRDNVTCMKYCESAFQSSVHLLLKSTRFEKNFFFALEKSLVSHWNVRVQYRSRAIQRKSTVLPSFILSVIDVFTLLYRQKHYLALFNYIVG